MKFEPHEYQKYCIDFICEHKEAALFLDMGLGKTVITLTALQRLLFDQLCVSKVLVIAPLRVARDTWSDEVRKWEHLQDLDVSVVVGDLKTRQAALQRQAQIYTVNRENVVWLVEYYEQRRLKWDFDCVVIDELSSFKSHQAKRFKALLKVRAYTKRWIGLTGTPAPKGLMDLWAEIKALDGGQRLGRFITRYRESFFTPGAMNWQTGVVFSYKLRPGAEEKIYSRISDMTVSMKALDFLKMPEVQYIREKIRLTCESKKSYDILRKNLMLTFDTGSDVDAKTAAGLSNKLLQMANGAVYDEDGKVHELHNAKLDALEDLIETANGQPVLVAYWFKHDRDRILKRLQSKGLKPGEIKSAKDIELWNAGKLAVALIHPASAGHGLNIQQGGHILIWFGLTWSLELYQQTNARLWRQGQKHTVVVYHLVAEGTIDESVLEALEAKDVSQEKLIAAVKAKIFSN